MGVGKAGSRLSLLPIVLEPSLKLPVVFLVFPRPPPEEDGEFLVLALLPPRFFGLDVAVVGTEAVSGTPVV